MERVLNHAAHAETPTASSQLLDRPDLQTDGTRLGIPSQAFQKLMYAGFEIERRQSGGPQLRLEIAAL